MCPDASVLGRPFYLMGYVDGWSPMDHKKWPSPFDTDLDARAGLAYQLAEGIALLSKVDWQAKVWRTSDVPTASTNAKSTAGQAFSSGSRARDRGPRRRDGVAAHPPTARLRPRHHARRLPVRQRDVPRRRTGRMAAIVDWEMVPSATRSSTWPGWCRAGPRTPARRRRRR